jgi:hypothetical protein
MEKVRVIVSMGLALRKQKNVAVRQPLQSLSAQMKSKALTGEFMEIALAELNIKQWALTPTSEMVSIDGAGEVEKVYLDVQISDSLRQEGLIRKLERVVQDLRKQQGFKVGEVVDVEYNIGDKILAQAMEGVNRGKLSIHSLKPDPELSGAEFEIDGSKFFLKISKV